MSSTVRLGGPLRLEIFNSEMSKNSHFSFWLADKMVLRFNADGTMEIGEGLKPDEAGRLALEAMGEAHKQLIRRAYLAALDEIASAIAKARDPDGESGSL